MFAHSPSREAVVELNLQHDSEVGGDPDRLGGKLRGPMPDMEDDERPDRFDHPTGQTA